MSDTDGVEAALDEIDLRLLDALQSDARLPQSALGSRVGLSTAAVNRRLRRLTETGVISGTAVTVAPEKLGRPVRVIAQVAVESEQLEKLDALRSALTARPEVQQCYYVAGEWDFILILIVRDMGEYTALTRELFFGNDNVRRFSTHVVMDAAKVGLTVALNPTPPGPRTSQSPKTT
ncbi:MULTISPECIES: Lrp/AsnC family transcriptional regulator [unclassified Brevibacterium]|uniref:Lrp/AsnC family transcriptional regulator n=1 Tax=unclassified Brevibacterium TaxID=2614124 RepID=UPI001E486979|nr:MULTISPECIES: Lrp/AsnC family transcriptional regulator [unclassified Brevibacterium]MDK8434371.1 Lrp/AsnC family transcriptional regulator [Brevibacterium sp. H-BE7]